MKVSKEVAIGIIAGLVMGVPQGFRDVENFSVTVSPEEWGGVAGFGFIAGLFLGMHLLSRANQDPKKHGMFAFILVTVLAIGIPTIARHFTGELLKSITLQAAFFTSIGLAMLLGGLLSAITSKNT